MDIMSKLHIATLAEDAIHMALEYGLGLEIDEYTHSTSLDDSTIDDWHDAVRRLLLGHEMKILHAPYNELSPASVDPLALDLTWKRLNQAYAVARHHQIRQMIVHSGYIPFVYDQDYFHHCSVKFWRRYMSNKPAEFRITIENEQEDDPTQLTRLVREIDDPRVGLCLNIGHAGLSPVPMDVWLEAYRPYVNHVVLHDNDGLTDRHWPLGDGVLPIKEVLTWFIRELPSMTYTIDTLLVRPSIQWLCRHGFMAPVNTPLAI